ncbi:MAG: CAP domain-containing protein [Acidimicrobiia bacterium]
MGTTTRKSVRAGRLALVVCLATSLLVIPPVAAGAAQNPGAYEVCLVDAVNDARQSAGIAPLTVAADLVPGVREHSAWMSDHEFQHMSSLQQEQILPDSSQTWGENIAWTSDFTASCSVIHDLLMNSSGHRANILNAGFDSLALGAHIDSSGTWVTQLFFRSPDYTPTWAGGFWDDDSSIFEAAVERLAAAGITNGCNPPANDRFCPDDYVTRGMMAAFLVRGLGL